MNDRQHFAMRTQDRKREERIGRQPYGSPCEVCGQTTPVSIELCDRLTAETDTNVSLCGDCAHRVAFLAGGPA